MDWRGAAVSCIAALLLATSGCKSKSIERTGEPAGGGAQESSAPESPIDERPVTIVMPGADAGAGSADASVASGPVTPPTGSAASIWIPARGDFALRDRETGSTWNTRGQAFAGALKGAELRQLAGYTVFWFSWSTAHDQGEVWRQDKLNRPGPIAADASGDCLVPCDEIRSGGPPPDGIPALDYLGRWDRPRKAAMVKADAPEADYLADGSPVLGVFLEGEAHAYPLALMNWHEIYIDRVGGTELNVTYCPLTGSGLVFPVRQADGLSLHLYTSGRLFNDNLTLFERDVAEPTYWNQILQKAIRGPRLGKTLSLLPVTETTWAQWRRMHPGTRVASRDTGYSRNYGTNPYTTQQAPDAFTLFPVNPAWEPWYPNKSKALALAGPKTHRAYAFVEMEKTGDRVVIDDVLDGTPIAVVYEREHAMAVGFERTVEGHVLTFEGATAP